ILRKSSAKWNFHFRSRPGNVNLCTLPLSNCAGFSPWPERNLALNGLNTFACLGEELSRRAGKEMLSFVRDVYPSRQLFDKWFPHAATATPYLRAAETLGLADK